MVTTIEIGIDQKGGPLKETIGEIEALAMIGLDQGPTLERKEIWSSYSTC